MTHLDFVKAWLEHRDVHKLSAATGLDTHFCHCLAVRLRRKGVLLPALPRNTYFKPAKLDDKLDVPALNKFLTER